MKNSTTPIDPLATTTFDDPVPTGCEESAVAREKASSHVVAADVQRVLQRLPGVIVESLVVRSLSNGAVLLEGTVQTTSKGATDFSTPVSQAIGGADVIDRLRVRQTMSLDETSFDGGGIDETRRVPK